MVAIRTRVWLRRNGQDPDLHPDLEGLIMSMATELNIAGNEYAMKTAKAFVRQGF